MHKRLIQFLLFIFSIQLFSQTNSAKIDSLKKLGRDSLIKLAVKKLNKPGFDAKAYDRIIVKATATSLVVEFSLSVKFSSATSCYYHKVAIALVGDKNGNNIQGDCTEPKFYKLTAEQEKKVDFVFKSINNSDEIGHVPNNKLNDETTMEISEKADHYYVEVSSWSTYSHYKIDKLSGKISEANHKHFDRSGYEKPDYEIIK